MTDYNTNIQLDKAIAQQQSKIVVIQDNLEKIFAANLEMQKSKNLQNKVAEFQRENQLTSRFKSFLKVYPTIKHWFIKSTEEKIESNISKNHSMFKAIDRTLINIGKESSLLQKVIHEDLAIGAYKLQEQLMEDVISNTPGAIKNHLAHIGISNQKWQEAVNATYTHNEMVELQKQNQTLNGIKLNINTLLDENKNVQVLTQLQTELNTEQSKFKKSLGEHIKVVWGNIKNVFQDTNIEKLHKAAFRNVDTINKMDTLLENALASINKSHKRRQEKLQKNLSTLHKNLNYDKVEQLMNLVKDVNGPLEYLDKGFAISFEQSDSTLQPFYQQPLQLQQDSTYQIPANYSPPLQTFSTNRIKVNNELHNQDPRVHSVVIEHKDDVITAAKNIGNELQNNRSTKTAGIKKTRGLKPMAVGTPKVPTR